MIAFYGASVTHQKNGYANVLESILEDKVQIFGYGGMHINNAGICFIDDVLAVEPSFCFIDFFSTSYMERTDLTKEYLDTIIYKFSSIGCKLIFLFFPKKEEVGSWYNFCRQFLSDRQINYIDVDIKLLHIEKELFLKDSVHTNQYGSKLYADVIMEEFKKLKPFINGPENLHPTRYLKIKKLKVEKSFDREIHLCGSAQIVGFLNTIGPYSGLVEIKTDDIAKRIIIWDEWCHYARLHFNLSFVIRNNAVIVILQEHFDTIKCKSKLDFTQYRKKMILHSIFYIGENLQLTNLNEGKHIFKLVLWYFKFKGRIKQLIQNKIRMP